MTETTPKPARGLFAISIAVSLAVAACGGGDTSAPTDGGQSTSTTVSAANTTTAAEPSATTTTQPMTETTAATGSASIEVDVSALPTDPSGFDTWSEDLCTLYSPDQLDSYFVGRGELATTEPLDRGCRWSVEGFPRSHYVDIVVVEDGTDATFVIDGQIDAAGTQVDIAHGPVDIVAMIPTPDGAFLKVLIHGDFDAPPGPLGSYLDDAAAGLAENIVSRF